MRKCLVLLIILLSIASISNASDLSPTNKNILSLKTTGKKITFKTEKAKPALLLSGWITDSCGNIVGAWACSPDWGFADFYYEIWKSPCVQMLSA